MLVLFSFYCFFLSALILCCYWIKFLPVLLMAQNLYTNRNTIFQVVIFAMKKTKLICQLEMSCLRVEHSVEHCYITYSPAETIPLVFTG